MIRPLEVGGQVTRYRGGPACATNTGGYGDILFATCQIRNREALRGRAQPGLPENVTRAFVVSVDVSVPVTAKDDTAGGSHMGMSCRVVAPRLVPESSGDRDRCLRRDHGGGSLAGVPGPCAPRTAMTLRWKERETKMEPSCCPGLRGSGKAHGHRSVQGPRL